MLLVVWCWWCWCREPFSRSSHGARSVSLSALPEGVSEPLLCRLALRDYDHYSTLRHLWVDRVGNRLFFTQSNAVAVYTISFTAPAQSWSPLVFAGGDLSHEFEGGICGMIGTSDGQTLLVCDQTNEQFRIRSIDTKTGAVKTIGHREGRCRDCRMTFDRPQRSPSGFETILYFTMDTTINCVDLSTGTGPLLRCLIPTCAVR